jgi:DNA (cytosine-5)-methyltransferase 1
MTVYFNFLDDVYYNEFDSYAADWLRNLIAAGHIAPGEVDTRSIEDVHPSDLQGFTQCHFFAGIGVWSLALRRAGWPDDRPVWTGSCPCQPFSAAGQGAGFADERHLWPHFFHLIGERRPAAVLGEQVASKDANPWIDLVQDDLEGLGYRVGAVPFPSAGVGAPHIRDRLYWVARATSERRNGRQDPARPRGRTGTQAGGITGGLDYADNAGLEGFGRGHQAESGRIGEVRPAAAPGESGRLADASGERRNGRIVRIRAGSAERAPINVPETGRGGSIVLSAGDDANGSDVGSLQEPASTGPTNGHWQAADWLSCRDGKWRPVEPGTFPLAHGAPARVGRLRAYGNAINAEAARVFIECVMEAA